MNEQPRRGGDHLERVQSIGALLIPPLLVVFLSYSQFIVCPSRMAGFSCPGCGLTRASQALFTGDFTQAHHYHPLVIPTLLLFGWFYLWSAAIILKAPWANKIDPREWIPTFGWLVYAASMIGLWVARLMETEGFPPIPV